MTVDELRKELDTLSEKGWGKTEVEMLHDGFHSIDFIVIGWNRGERNIHFMEGADSEDED